jgi:hypothetical protein
MMAIAVGLGKRVRVDGGWVDGYVGEACPEGLGVRVDGCVTEA